MLSVSKPTMYKLANRDDFDAEFRVGGRRLLSVAKLEAWIEMQTRGKTDTDKTAS